jgi:hypothetical protein
VALQLYERIWFYDNVTRTEKNGLNFPWGAVSTWSAPGVLRSTLKGLAQNVSVGDLASISTGQEAGGSPDAIVVDDGNVNNGQTTTLSGWWACILIPIVDPRNCPRYRL